MKTNDWHNHVLIYMCFHMFFNPTLTFHAFKFVFHGFHTFHTFPWSGQHTLGACRSEQLPQAGKAKGKCEKCENHEKQMETMKSHSWIEKHMKTNEKQ